MRLVNRAGVDLIKKYENDNDPKAGYRIQPDGSCYFVPYIDPVGVCTIGFGTIMYENGVRVTMKDPAIGLARAHELLQFELHEKAEAIESFCTRNNLNWTDNQFAALVSLAYNCGIGAVTDHDSSMRAALLCKDSNKIPAAFRLWVKGTVKVLGIPVKKTLPGLVKRREAEIALFFSR